MCKRLLLFLSFAASISASGQVAPAPKDSGRFSESRAYVPRLLETDKKKSDKKKKEQKSDAKPAPPVVSASDTSGPFVIPVSVFDARGTLIKDLQQNEFHVFLNDAEADVVSVEKSVQQRSVLILVDTSSSTEVILKETKILVDSIVQSLDPSDEVMVAQFSDQLKVLSKSTSDRTEIEKAIKLLKSGDGTSIYDALDKVSKDLAGILTGRALLLLVTDGVDTTSRKADFATSLAAVEKTNVTVFPIYLDTFGLLPAGINQAMRSVPVIVIRGVGMTEKEHEIGRHYLNDLARMSGGRAISKSDPIHKSMPSIGEQLRNEYILTVKPRSPIRIGERSIVKVRVARPGLTITARGSIIPTQ